MKRRRIYSIIRAGYMDDKPSLAYDFVLMTAILITLAIAVFDTFSAAESCQNLIRTAETITVIFFTADYLLRVWTADYIYEGRYSRGKAGLKFIFSLTGIVDFLSCIPYFLPFTGDFLRIFRIIRILRVFRVHKYADPLHVIASVINKKKGQLLSSIFIVLVLIITSSLLMYALEHEAQPEVFSNAFSGFWWAVNTLLTVGYGDIVPITFAGKICGTLLTFLGVGMVAIPTGILSAGFMEQVSHLKREEELEELKHILTLAEANVQARHEEQRQAIITSSSNTSVTLSRLANPSEISSLSGAENSYHYCPYCGHKLP